MRHEILLFSDLHLHNWSFGSTFDESGHNSRLTQGLQVISRMYEQADERSIPHIIFPGDLFHSRNSISSQVIQRTFETLKECAQDYPNIDLTILLGNHDWDRSVTFSSVMIFDSIPRVKVVSSAERVSFFNGEVNCLFIPYTPHSDKFKNIIIKNSGVDAIFVHQGFSGLSVDPRNYFIDEIASVDAVTQWGKNSQVDLISGHFHDHSLLTSSESGLFGFFVGASLQQNFGDVGQPRGFVTYELGSRKPNFHSMNGYFPAFVDVTEASELSSFMVTGNFIRLRTTDRLMAGLEEHVLQFDPRSLVRKYVPQELPASGLQTAIDRTPSEVVTDYVMERAGGLSRQNLLDFYRSNV